MSQIECQSCHAMLPMGTKFCTSCGARIAPQPAPEPEPEPEVEPEPAPPSHSGNDVPSEAAWSGAHATQAPPPRPAPLPHLAPAGPPRYSGLIEYDPVVIQSFAAGLYRLADSIVLSSTIIGAIIGGVVGFGAGSFMSSGASMMLGLFGLAAGGYMGRSRGLSKTFMLRLEAQLALCQVEIELNTRCLRQ